MMFDLVCTLVLFGTLGFSLVVCVVFLKWVFNRLVFLLSCLAGWYISCVFLFRLAVPAPAG